MANDKMTCINCGKTLAKASFFKHRNKFISDSFSICKNCVKEILCSEKINDNFNDFHRLLRLLDVPLIEKDVESATNSSVKSEVGKYISMMNLSARNKNYEDSDIFNKKSEFKEISNSAKNEIVEVEQETSSTSKSEDDIRNEKECIRLLGYDAFKGRSDEDRVYLFNNLIGFLDETTLNDGFKLSASIEIVELFNQVNKTNKGLNDLMKDPKAIVENLAVIKTGADTKQKLTSVALNLAKDNGISINNNKNKSNKGAGTLTGIIKELKEKDFDEAEINLFDIETSHGMSQVADISNNSIIKQLQFDENDYSEMIIEQRILINKAESRADTSEETLRKTKFALNVCKEILKENGLDYKIPYENEGEE